MRYLLLVLSLYCSFVNASQPVYGWLEKAKLLPANVTITAKLDTGAKSSSIDAREIKAFTKNDVEWVSFKVPIKKLDKELYFERKVIGQVKIKTRNIAYKMLKQSYQKRYIVEMDVCLADHKETLRVNLVNRERFNYPLLLGRESIKKYNGLVDPSESFLHDIDCKP